MARKTTQPAKTAAKKAATAKKAAKKGSTKKTTTKKAGTGRPTQQAVAQIKEIHLMQQSLQFSDPIRQTRSDLNWSCQQGADVIGLTEGNDQDTRNAINSVARANGYSPVVFPSGDVHFMVKTGGAAACRITATGQTKVANGTSNYGPKYVSWVKLKWYGVDVYVHETHPPRLEDNRQVHEQQSRVLAQLVKQHGAGAGFSFFMGDINIDEGEDNRSNNPNMPNYIFRANGLLTIWDEFNVVPQPTISHSVFDIVGSYRPDGGIAGTRYKVWPQQNSDHRPVSAWYNLQVVGGTQLGYGDLIVDNSDPIASWDGSDGDTTAADPDFYATGGNIDWSDYQDATLYPLPFAVDDSDSPDHG